MNYPDVKKIKVIQAPIAGVSDFVFRNLIRKYNAKETLLTTEMISSEAVCQKPYSNITEFSDVHYPLAFQIAGHKPLLMAKAASILQERATFIDINAGCPVNKIVKNGDGSSLMRNIPLMKEIIKEIKREIKIPLSVKFRLGWSENEKNYIEFAKVLEGEGVDFITLHARTRSEMYSGRANLDDIKKLKNAVKIPVFANGDIKTVEDIKNCIEYTGADGVSIGRRLIGDFSFASRAETFFKTGEMLPPPSLKEKIEMLKIHLEEEIKFRGEECGVKFVRKFYPYYIAGIQNASKLRGELVLMNNPDDIYKAIENVLCLHAAD